MRGFEGYLGEADDIVDVGSRLRRQHIHGSLGGLSDHPPAFIGLFDPRIVGHPGGQHQSFQVGMVREVGCLTGLGRDAAGGLISGALDLVDAVGGDDAACGHLVLGEGSGLVRADGGDRTQGLDRGHLAGDGIALGHLLNAEGECHRHQGRQAFRDCGDREPDRRRHQLVPGEVVEDASDQQHHDGEQADEDRQLFAQVGQLTGQRGIELVLVGDQRRNASDLGVGTGGDHHSLAGACGDDRAREEHGRTVTETGLYTDRNHVLLGRHRFAGHGGFVRLQRRRLQQPQVGGYPVAGPDTHDIADHQGGGVHHTPAVVAQRLSVQRLHVLKAGQRGRGATLLNESDDRGGHDDNADHREVDPVAADRLEYGSGDQNVDQHIVEVRQQATPGGLLGRFGKRVAAVSLEPSGCLSAGQTAGRGVQQLEHVLRGLCPRFGIGCRLGSIRHCRHAPRV